MTKVTTITEKFNKDGTLAEKITLVSEYDDKEYVPYPVYPYYPTLTYPQITYTVSDSLSSNCGSDFTKAMSDIIKNSRLKVPFCE